MATHDSAEQKLHRILYLLPAAARPDGVALQELAEVLGVDRKKVLRDATEAGDRAYYHFAGHAAEANIWLDGERVTLATPGHFRRPVRLGAREAAALGLGLRSLAAESAPERRAHLMELTRLLERALVLPAAKGAGERVLSSHGDRPAGDVLAALKAAATERRVCSIRYVKPDSRQPEPRTIEPYSLLFAERWWYAVSRCCDRADIRLFRVDRVLEVEAREERFDVPRGFDPLAYAPNGRAFVSGSTVEAEVRYTARIAPWIREQFPEAEPAPHGSVVVRHAIANPSWLVRHVLQYGGEAEVLSPDTVREAVRASVRRFLAPASGS